MVRAHKSTINLEVKNGIGMLTWSDMEGTEGPQKGQRFPFSMTYIYKIDGDTFYEVNNINGLRGGEPNVVPWKRVKE